MNKSKLDEIFNAYFNGKLDFSEMLTLNITNNINTISVGSRQVVKCSSNLKRIHSFLNLFIFDF